MNNRISLQIATPIESVFEVLKNLELLFRLNIQWHLKSLSISEPIRKNATYAVKVQYDRTDEVVDYTVSVVNYVPNLCLELELRSEKPRRLAFTLERLKDGTGVFHLEDVREENLSREELLELNLWAKSIVDYANISHSKRLVSRVWKFLLDKVYLKLSPTGRRVVFFIVVSEIFALLFFIMLAIYFLFFKQNS